jgi:HJR/Mrr/RecB family endonuclease
MKKIIIKNKNVKKFRSYITEIEKNTIIKSFKSKNYETGKSFFLNTIKTEKISQRECSDLLKSCSKNFDLNTTRDFFQKIKGYFTFKT